MIEIAQFSGWPYLALVSSHDLFLHLVQCAPGGLPTAAAAPLVKISGMTAMKWRRGWPQAACKRLPGPPRCKGLDAVWWCSRLASRNIRLHLASRGGHSWSPRACAATGPLFGFRLRSDAYGRGFGQGLPASVPGLQKPGFDARCSPPRRTSGSN